MLSMENNENNETVNILPKFDSEEDALINNILKNSNDTAIVPKKQDQILDDPAALENFKGPGVHYELYLRNELIAERLKLLNYENEFVSLSNSFKVLSRHYFVKNNNVGEQFHIFTSLATWLIKKAKIAENLEMPHEFDDPNTVLSNIINALKLKNIDVPFTTTKLKSGSGAQCIYVLDILTTLSIASKNIMFEKIESVETENDYDNKMEDEDDLNNRNIKINAAEFDDEDDIVTAADDEDVDDFIQESRIKNFIDTEIELDKSQSDKLSLKKELKPILNNFIDVTTMNAELRRVIPQLKIIIRTETKDWKMHIEQIDRYEKIIDSQFSNTLRPYLTQNIKEISETIERIASRETHLNTQFNELMHTFRLKQNELAAVTEKYNNSSGTLNSRDETLNNLNNEIEQIKHQIEDQGIKNTNGTPILKIKQAISKLEKSIFTMRVQIVAAEQTLFQSQLTDRLNISGHNDYFS